jgi:hypothetical protein
MDASCFLLACIPRPSPHNTASGACLFSPSLDTLISQGSVSWQSGNAKASGTQSTLEAVHLMQRSCTNTKGRSCTGQRTSQGLGQGTRSDWVSRTGEPSRIQEPAFTAYFCLATRVVGVSQPETPALWLSVAVLRLKSAGPPPAGAFCHSARPPETSGCVLCRWDERINGTRSHPQSRSPDLTFDLPSHLIEFWIQEVSQESGEKDVNAQLSIP